TGRGDRLRLLGGGRSGLRSGDRLDPARRRRPRRLPPGAVARRRNLGAGAGLGAVEGAAGDARRSPRGVRPARAGAERGAGGTRRAGLTTPPPSATAAPGPAEPRGFPAR